ncbi:1-deoxy-D-xylulose-5-phosphate synthase [Anaerocolumna xylanovorans]|uniref:1-deoxy-D-xylulose-5-phosphate synthase n=1 Tax=Anaerocolumna xylanovorans DSM 12503 TaxID=1121345 RepID=A0A1M7YIT1_9FIRM|nr:1-deoxy-D-xylulose-5-phosphate synthase [Anaerocolumna xylanovorans]SHO52544.1 1-deoxy-D-xylulose-5-phosphate synthase [Anaerocolumna xylanovorans DSM 12503]
MSGILDLINEANDIKKVKPSDYNRLAGEIREFIIENISKTGGHLASNLGTVELTMALHLYLDFPEDKLVWDVGHQAYTHKLLTGRKKDFASLRTFEGLSGFPKRKESNCDCFDTGHSSTSLSAAMGLVRARDLKGTDEKVVAVIGDGALSGGMAFEALNNAAELKSNLIIILNDNKMSISENVGGMANYLGKLRTGDKYINLKQIIEKALNNVPGIGHIIADKVRKSKDSIKRLVIPGMLFEDMGLTYIGPIDGHNLNELQMALASASKAKKAVIIHAITKKGRGYKPAEKNPSYFHGVDAFDVKTGKNSKVKKGITYTEIFSDTMLELGEMHKDLVAITAAMPSGTGLNKFKQKYPERFFDVGIAEEHAVTFAAGLALGGMKPVVAVYSTFLQRAYDQIVHDVCLSSLPVIFAIDRAGIVGNDGETHQGIFDVSFLSHIPSLTLMAPKNAVELIEMLHFAYAYNGPVAVRYPRGRAYEGLSEFQAPIVYGKSEVIYQSNTAGKKKNTQKNRILLLAAGSMVEAGAQIHDILVSEGREVTLVNIRFIKPMDTALLKEMAAGHGIWVTLEENVQRGSYGEGVASYLFEQNLRDIRLLNITLPNQFIEQGDVSVLKEKLGFDTASLTKRIKDFISHS